MGISEIAGTLSEIGGEFYRRGWMLGTSGNLSAVISREPLRLGITASGANKGSLTAGDIVEVDELGDVVSGKGKASAETKLHLSLVRLRGAGAVLHTHSVWSTILSKAYAADRAIEIEGYEMLKGLEGIATHEHTEVLPIMRNSQDPDELVAQIEECLGRHPAAHGFLVQQHGLYTWGRDLNEARRHVEILEFLLEVRGRTASGGFAR